MDTLPQFTILTLWVASDQDLISLSAMMNALIISIMQEVHFLPVPLEYNRVEEDWILLQLSQLLLLLNNQQIPQRFNQRMFLLMNQHLSLHKDHQQYQQMSQLIYHL